MADIKPCPFCGGPAALGEIAEGHEDHGGRFIACINPQCGASTNLRFPLMDDVVPLLVEQWNRRATLAPREPHAEALRRLRSLKVLLGTDSPEVRGWAPAVQQAAQRAVNTAIRALGSADGEPSMWERQLRAVVRHWNEFGPSHGFGEQMDCADTAIRAADGVDLPDGAKR